MTLPRPELLIVTDRAQAAAPLEDVLNAAFVAGCRWASVREKDLPAQEQRALAQRLHEIAGHYRARLILHGDAELAREAGIDGVHLPGGADARAARALLGHRALIGISVHTPEEAAALDRSVVDYAIAGPAYASASKPHYGPILGMVGIEKIANATQVPIIAIGGIAPGVISEMRIAGAVGVAVMGSVMRAKEPGALVERLVQEFG
jgi:thiamine-phosphate pyrophosphorylase